jgi:HSP20 family protein
MSHSRDLFANFERMRREVDELFGEVFDPHRRRSAFSPAVDVFYVGDPPRAVVHAELPGVNPDEVKLEVRGRELILVGRRLPPRAEGRLYQQIEIEHGGFRRIVPLGADVDAENARADYRNGILEVVLPLKTEREAPRSVPIRRADDPGAAKGDLGEGER